MRDVIEAQLRMNEQTARDIVAKAEAEHRSELTAHESQTIKTAVDTAKELRASLAELDALDKRDAEREELARSIQPEPNADPRISVRSEPATYTPEAPHSFFTDLINRNRDDYDAEERIRRHAEETRATATGNLGDGIVPPQYLSDKFAHVKQAGLVIAKLAGQVPMPEQGMTLTVPLGVTTTLVTGQSGENTQVANQDPTATDLTVPLNTYAGFSDISIQSVERGVLVDELVYSDLVRSHNAQLERDLAAGPGTNGRHLGILGSGVLSVTCTTSDYSSFRRAVINGGQRVASSHYDSATVLVVHPRRWAWLSLATDGEDRPQIASDSAAVNAGASQSGVVAQGAVGTLAGYPVYLSPSIPTAVSNFSPAGGDGDVAFLTRASDLVYAQDDAVRVRFDAPGAHTLTSRFVLRSYSAFSARRYTNASVIIHGVGLTAPNFG